MNNHANPVEMVKDIYKITNNINGKIYIGQSKNTKERFKSHCKETSKDCLIDLAIQKYGKENFTVEIIESQIKNYNEREKYWIKFFNCKVPNGYNISDGGDEPPVFYGINHPNASIKSQAILNCIIQDLIETKLPYNTIAQKYHTNKKTIMGINFGYRYSNPDLDYPLRKQPNINGTLADEDIDDIIYELQHSYDTNTNIGLHYGVGEHTIRNINAGRAHHRENIIYPIRPINAARAKVTYDELLEIIELLQHSNKSINSIAQLYRVDWNIIQNINLGTGLYRRSEFFYPLRLPPHKK